MGNVTVEFSNSTIEVGSVLSKITNAGDKDVTLFVGLVRDRSDGMEVQGVAYLAYEPLVKSTLLQLCREAQLLLPSEPEIFLVHRIGYTAAGEISIAIAVDSDQTQDAERVFRHIMGGFESQAPFRRKEYYGNGDSKWLPAACL